MAIKEQTPNKAKMVLWDKADTSECKEWNEWEEVQEQSTLSDNLLSLFIMGLYTKWTQSF